MNAKYTYGPPSTPRRGGGWYGHFPVGKWTKRLIHRARVEEAHIVALAEDRQREDHKQ